MIDPNETGPNGPNADAPLSSEAQAVINKARRSFGISIGILLLGFMAIAFALVYRVMRDAPPPAVAEIVSVPAGAQIVSASVNDGSINVTYQIDGVTTLSLFDQSTGALKRSVVIATE
ncbi:hypothetical protein WH87_01755 [Devosia epidermidihirudinis]|uniref:Uncharacterized protein n=1 Tax=Devosia epidermidihirudinis TaxID=1293439 RepID=A0A0F5QJI9_9HYPH|nr:DUF6476 family protein [Devosia epidermidihirudinis]KKC40911.1 hypothetical protein WH87_01755 [Devosia epidermidihirudinis]